MTVLVPVPVSICVGVGVGGEEVLEGEGRCAAAVERKVRGVLLPLKGGVGWGV